VTRPAAADLDPTLPEALRLEAAAWATVADGLRVIGTPEQHAFGEAFLAAHPELDSDRVWMEGPHDVVRLLPAFGLFVPGDETHRRLCWLCVNATRMVLHCWDGIAENPDARDRLSTLAGVLRGDWFQKWDGPEPDWVPLTNAAVAVRDGRTIGDCDACRVEPIATAVAHAARFARDGDLNDAAICLQHVQVAESEGCWWCDPAIPDAANAEFATWFALHTLPASWRCEELPACDPGVPVWRVV